MNNATPQNRAKIVAFFKMMEERDPMGDLEQEMLNPKQYREWATKQIEKYGKTRPFMKNVVAADYFKWGEEKQSAEFEEEQKELSEIGKTTPEQFWNAALQFNPNGSSWNPYNSSCPKTHANATELVRLLASERVPVIPLGKLYGERPVALVPGPDSMPLSGMNLKEPSGMVDLAEKPFPAAQTDAGGIIYPDGHPSVDYDEGGSRYESEFDPSEEGERNKLTRFWPLGWPIYTYEKAQPEYTGHVLVMDMDKGRNRHPWLVIASSWPNPMSVDGDFTRTAPYRVRLDEPEVDGIFPGGTRRTPVAKMRHLPGAKLDQKPHFFHHFGPDFNFTIDRMGGDRQFVRSREFKEHHPDLAIIVGWYWDEDKQQEVCYDAEGKEYKRFNSETGRYQARVIGSVVGQFGMFGEVIPESTGGIPLEKSLALMDASLGEREEETSLKPSEMIRMRSLFSNY